jgi:threonine dehydrogenase-like Zn-dependent dehydrogenase
VCEVKALQIMAPGRAEVIQLPVPQPAPGEVLVRVSLVNTCPQWDLHLDAGEPMFVGHQIPYPYTPGQPGHEMTGTVAAVGEGVEEFRVGQRVAAWRDAGHDRQGCYAEYVCHNTDHLLPVPDSVDDRGIASLELAMCVAVSVLPLKKLDAIAGKRAAVNGLGPAGLIAGQMLRAEGATSVIGFEPNARRRDLAVGLAVDEAFDPRDPATAERVPPRAGGAAVDVAIDCVGYPDATRYLMDHTGRHVALFAVQRHDYTYALGHAGLTVIGYEGHYKAAAEYALGLIAAGKINLRPLISVELPLEQYAEGLALLRRQEAIKIGFRP